jgi:hypothetical membrane protein
MEYDTTQARALTAYLSIIAITAQLILLVSLHWLSPEFDPAWRVISEYANGNHSWILSLLFAAGAVSAWALAAAIWSQIKAKTGRLGLWFLLAAGTGSAMAAIFDINHPWHNMAGLLGTIGTAVAAMLISRSLARSPPWADAKCPLRLTAHLIWISLVLFVATTVLLGITYTQAGGEMPPEGQALPIGATLASGTVAINGWFNRLMVLAGGLWTVTVAWLAIKRQS